MDGNKPVKQIRLGTVKASIWANETPKGIRHSVTVTRIYKDVDDNWKETQSFNRDDLLLVAKISDMAHSAIFEIEAK